MPKINVNGVTREMAPEEIAAFEARTAEIPGQPQTELEKRLEELESALELLLERYGDAYIRNGSN